jgi:hypothetical protein
MKRFSYNLGKNIKLKLERGIGFESVLNAIMNGNFKVARIKSEAHYGQSCYLIRYNGKNWSVPFTEYKHKIYLHTIFEKD